jgi:hypothetical protein
VTDKAPRTIRELAEASRPWLEKRGVDNPRLDAELLIAHALGMKRVDLYMDWDRPLSDDEIAKCRELVKRRGAREPVSLILGAREFWGLPFVVTKDTLAPRPETELLVELTLARVAKDAATTFVDACTGTGCVAIALLKERPSLRAIVTDISPAALDVARENARRNGVADRFDAREGDLLAAVKEERSRSSSPIRRTSARASARRSRPRSAFTSRRWRSSVRAPTPSGITAGSSRRRRRSCRAVPLRRSRSARRRVQTHAPSSSTAGAARAWRKIWRAWIASSHLSEPERRRRDACATPTLHKGRRL